MIGRRGMLGLVAGAAAASTQRGLGGPRRYFGGPPQTVGYASGLNEASDFVESAVRRAIRSKIDDGHKANSRRMRRLMRLKSISPAFIESEEIGHSTVMQDLWAELEKAP